MINKKNINLYAMHRYDLIFYVRFIRLLEFYFDDFAIRLVVTDYLYNLNHAKSFIHKNFDKVLIAPIHILRKNKFSEKVKFVYSLRSWYTKNINSNELMILTDKSNLFSRFFLKNSKNVILFQQIEKIDNIYKFNAISTISDSIYALIIGACLAKHYIHKSSTDMRALKIINFGKKKYLKVFHDNCLSDEENNFEFPLLEKKDPNKIVIFGSRFFTWDYLIKDKQRMNIFKKKIYEIYLFLFNKLKNYEYYYIPHPLEKGLEFEFINNIFNNNLIKPIGYFSSEHFLYENRDIAYTFSIGSTSSFSAYSMGYSSKVFFKMLDLPIKYEETLSDIFSGFPKNFFANSNLDLLKPEVKIGYNNNHSLINYLKNYDK